MKDIAHYYLKFFLLFAIYDVAYSQSKIDLYSITNSRQVGGDAGYTFDGKWFPDTRSKLLNPIYFGPQGTYSKTIQITDAFGLSGSLTEVTKLPTNSIFFFGSFNKIEPAMEAFMDEEIDSLYNWSVRGGKMIITCGLDFVAYSNYSSILNKKWNYQMASLTPTVGCHATAHGLTTSLFNGPFGSVNSVRQGGGAQGIYYKYPSDIKVMATNSEGKPTIYMDCKTLDLMVADVDVFSSLSNVAYYNAQMQIVSEGISTGDLIKQNNDVFLGNVMVFLDNLQQPPVLVKDGDQLSVNNNYVNYQWYKNGEVISNANTSVYTSPSFGEDIYYVEVEVNGGCKIRSNEFNPECEIFVPTAFSPNKNGMNEKACVYNSCIDKMEFKIFNRWGELIFTSSELETCWDGTYKDSPAPEGVYGWSMEGVRKSGSKVSKKGNITLVR